MADGFYSEGDLLAAHTIANGGGTGFIPKVALTDASGAAVSVPTTASSTATATQVASTTSATTLLAANTARRGATIYYDGAAILYLLEGTGTPSSTVYTGKLGAGLATTYEANGFTGIIKGIWSAAVGSANVTERTA